MTAFTTVTTAVGLLMATSAAGQAASASAQGISTRLLVAPPHAATVAADADAPADDQSPPDEGQVPLLNDGVARLLPPRAPVQGPFQIPDTRPDAKEGDGEGEADEDDLPSCVMPIVPADPSVDSRMPRISPPSLRFTMPTIDVACRP